MMIIGDRNVFAFQYKVEMEQPILMLKNCLWIQGKFLGNHEDSGTLSAVVKGLTRLINQNGNFYEEEFLNKTPEEVMLIMIPNLYDSEKKFSDFSEEEQNMLVKYDRYLYSFGENYDNFIIRVYAINGDYHFLWKLRPEPWQELEVKSYQGYSRDIQHGKVAFKDLKKILDELMKEFPEKRFS